MGRMEFEEELKELAYLLFKDPFEEGERFLGALELTPERREALLEFVTPPEVCRECGAENPECGWTLMRAHDPRDRTCYNCAPPPYGIGKN